MKTTRSSDKHFLRAKNKIRRPGPIHENQTQKSRFDHQARPPTKSQGLKIEFKKYVGNQNLRLAEIMAAVMAVFQPLPTFFAKWKKPHEAGTLKLDFLTRYICKLLLLTENPNKMDVNTGDAYDSEVEKMIFLKFCTILFFFFAMSFSHASFKNFSTTRCIKSNFEISVSHPAYPLGLTNNIIRIKKNNCEILISHERLKFLKKNWLIDVCREPVHIKKQGRSIDIVKKTVPCKKNSITKNDFCSEYFSIRQKILDDGLIFAKGEKENLNDEHGKMYCTYRLLVNYLGESNVLSRYHKIQAPPLSPKKQDKPSPKEPPAPVKYRF